MASANEAVAKDSCVECVDFVEFYCNNAKILASYFCTTFGFAPLGIKSEICLESGNRRERISRVVSQDGAYLVITSTLSDNDQGIHNSLRIHGDSVTNVGLRVKNTEEAYERAIAAGAKSITKPCKLEDEYGYIILAVIASPIGDITHTLVERSHYKGTFLPGFKDERSTNNTKKGFGLTHIDHIAVAFHRNSIMEPLAWYQNCLGFHRFFADEAEDSEGLSVNGNYGGLKTVVASCSSSNKHCFKFVLVEALEDNPNNQIEEYLRYNGGPGVQHLALHTEDIVHTVSLMKENSLEFIQVPPNYYETLFNNEGSFLKGEWKEFEQLGILLDVTPHGQYLLQTFTKPLQDRPTLFMEIISRKGSFGFGRNTILALFKAVEQLQKERQKKINGLSS